MKPVCIKLLFRIALAVIVLAVGGRVEAQSWSFAPSGGYSATALKLTGTPSLVKAGPQFSLAINYALKNNFRLQVSYRKQSTESSTISGPQRTVPVTIEWFQAGIFNYMKTGIDRTSFFAGGLIGPGFIKETGTPKVDMRIGIGLCAGLEYCFARCWGVEFSGQLQGIFDQPAGTGNNPAMNLAQIPVMCMPILNLGVSYTFGKKEQ
jgi:hypothetical protein